MVQLEKGLWRSHQQPGSLASRFALMEPSQTGPSSAALFSFHRTPPPTGDRRIACPTDWYQAKVHWGHDASVGNVWAMLFRPSTDPRWLIEIVQTGFGHKPDAEALTLWVGSLAEHPNRGARRIRFFGHGQRNAGEGPSEGLSFVLTQQVPGDPSGPMDGYPPDWLQP